jgi:hypothetical protein
VPHGSSIAVDERFQRACDAIDELHRGDPSGEELPYAERMSKALDALMPEAGAQLRLAVRAQHLCRWKVPRASYPEGKAGYLRWRTEQSKLHAQLAREVLTNAGYDEAFAGRVAELVRKKNLANDPEAQAVEDAACLVFLEHHLSEFARDRDRAQVIDVLRKTWRKMSVRGHELALALKLDRRDLVEAALEPT